jgi:hypothetical protein
MKTNTAEAFRTVLSLPVISKPSLFAHVRSWIKTNEPVWEENRIGITATGIFLQVTAAAIMICLAGMAGGSPFAFGAGILFAFLADSLVLAQSPMRWITGIMAASIIVNISLAVYFAFQLLQ